MSEQQTTLLLHIGPVREESQRLIQQADTSVLAITPPQSAIKQDSIPEVRLIEAWVTPQGVEQTCYHYSLQDFNSLAKATGLKTIYPGITLLKTQVVETLAVKEVLEEQTSKHTIVTGVIIEQPDQALVLLKELERLGRLASLKHLWVRTSPTQLYAEMPVHKGLLEWCESQGLEPVSEEAEDPEFRLQGFKRNHLYAELRKVRQQNHEQNQRVEKAIQERDAIQKSLASAQQKADQAQQEAVSLREKVQELTQRNQTLINESEATQKKQHQLEIELERAEAQLELIKDLLLKDKLFGTQNG